MGGVLDKLFDFIKKGNIREFFETVTRYAKPNSYEKCTNSKSFTFLHYATIYNQLEIMRGLLELGMDINMKNQIRDANALHIAIKRTENRPSARLNQVLLLIKYKADVNIKCKDKTPLELVEEKLINIFKNKEKVKYLTENWKNIKIEEKIQLDINGKEYIEIFRILQNPQIISKLETLRTLLLNNNFAEITKILTDEPSLITEEILGLSILEEVIVKKKTDMTKMIINILFQHDREINEHEKFILVRSLNEAIKTGNEKIAEFLTNILITRQIDINRENLQEKTPINLIYEQLIEIFQDEKQVKDLTENWKNIKIKRKLQLDIRGRKFIEISELLQKSEIINQLEKLYKLNNFDEKSQILTDEPHLITEVIFNVPSLLEKATEEADINTIKMMTEILLKNGRKINEHEKFILLCCFNQAIKKNNAVETETIRTLEQVLTRALPNNNAKIDIDNIDNDDLVQILFIKMLKSIPSPLSKTYIKENIYSELTVETILFLLNSETANNEIEIIIAPESEKLSNIFETRGKFDELIKNWKNTKIEEKIQLDIQGRKYIEILRVLQNPQIISKLETLRTLLLNDNFAEITKILTDEPSLITEEILGLSILEEVIVKKKTDITKNIIEILFKDGRQINEHEKFILLCCFNQAIRTRDIEKIEILMEALIKAKLDINNYNLASIQLNGNKTEFYPSRNFTTPFHLAALANIRIFQKLIEISEKNGFDTKTLINMYDLDYNTALHAIIINNDIYFELNLEMILFLLNNGADVNKTNSQGKTPLNLVEEKLINIFGTKDKLDKSIKNWKNINIEEKIQSDIQSRKYIEILRVLQNPQIISKSEKLLTLLDENNSAEITKILTDEPSLITEEILTQPSFLEKAIKKQDINIIKIMKEILLKDGRQINEHEKFILLCSFNEAIKTDNIEIIRILMEALIEAQIDMKNYNLAGTPWTKNKVAFFQSRDFDFVTPFHIAVSGKIETLKELVKIFEEKGIDVKTMINMHDLNHNTPLHRAAEKENSNEIISFLIDNGADLNIKNRRNQTSVELIQIYKKMQNSENNTKNNDHQSDSDKISDNIKDIENNTKNNDHQSDSDKISNNTKDIKDAKNIKKSFTKFEIIKDIIKRAINSISKFFKKIFDGIIGKLTCTNPKNRGKNTNSTISSPTRDSSHSINNFQKKI